MYNKLFSLLLLLLMAVANTAALETTTTTTTTTIGGPPRDPPEYTMEDPNNFLAILPPSEKEEFIYESSTGVITSNNNYADHGAIVDSKKKNHTDEQLLLFQKTMSSQAANQKLLTCENVTCSDAATPKCIVTKNKGAMCTADACMYMDCKDDETCVNNNNNNENNNTGAGLPVCIKSACIDANCNAQHQECIIVSTTTVDGAVAECRNKKVCKPNTCLPDETCQPKTDPSCSSSSSSIAADEPCPLVAECTSPCSTKTCKADETCKARNGVAQCLPAHKASNSSSYTEPSWWRTMVQGFVDGGRLKRCSRRNNVAPLSGTRCSKREKTCFFEDQTCPGMLPDSWPKIRCNCDGNQGSQTWICVDFQCPVI